MIPEPRHFACLALPIELMALFLRAKSPLIYSTISCFVRNIILSVLGYIFAFIHTIFTLHVQRDIIPQLSLVFQSKSSQIDSMRVGPAIL